MAAVQSTMMPLGTPAPYFRLPDTQGAMVSLDDFKNNAALLVVFMCNHCPYVKHIQKGLVSLVKDLQAQGVAVVGISSNDIDSYPEDSPAMMAEEAFKAGYTFPYLYDASQEVAKAFVATCTPDFYLFDKNRTLVYRGQMDDSRPGNALPVTGNNLRAAVEELLAEQPITIPQKPSIGCSIKWKPNNKPDYWVG